jgi:hypothetical protein
MNRSKPLARAIVTMLASSALLCLAACAPKVGQQITKAQESYDAGRYDEAYKEAVAAYDSSASDVKSGDDGASSAKNDDAARAAYLAGLSAYQLENYNDSERYLEAALGAGEGELAGRAQAQLGAVALKEKRYVDAAEAYEGAAKLLSGDEADKARQRAEQARRQINATPGPSHSRDPRRRAWSGTAPGAPTASARPLAARQHTLATSWTARPAVRVAATGECDGPAEFVDPAAFRPMLQAFNGSSAESLLEVYSFLATRGDEGHAALAWEAIHAVDTSIRGEAVARIARPPAEAVLAEIDSGLRSPTHAVANAAGFVAGALGAVQAIPLLIFAQATGDVAETQGDLAWIVIGTQTSYVANVIPVVGDNSGAFQPVLGLITEGTLLRVMDAVVVTYRIDAHNALVSMTTREYGESTEFLGYDMPKWYAWYNEKLMPLLEERAKMAKMLDESGA